MKTDLSKSLNELFFIDIQAQVSLHSNPSNISLTGPSQFQYRSGIRRAIHFDAQAIEE